MKAGGRKWLAAHHVKGHFGHSKTKRVCTNARPVDTFRDRLTRATGVRLNLRTMTNTIRIVLLHAESLLTGIMREIHETTNRFRSCRLCGSVCRLMDAVTSVNWRLLE
mgnify:FL=1